MEIKGLHIGGVSSAAPVVAAKPALKPKEYDHDAVKISVRSAAPTAAVSSSASSTSIVGAQVGGGDVSGGATAD